MIKGREGKRGEGKERRQGKEGKVGRGGEQRKGYPLQKSTMIYHGKKVWYTMDSTIVYHDTNLHFWNSKPW
jgi:hypothetical protein